MVDAGDIVLFKIGEPDIYRPLLVTVGGVMNCSGILFTDTAEDKRTEYVQKAVPFYHSEKHSISLHDVHKGSNVGQWQEKA